MKKEEIIIGEEKILCEYYKYEMGIYNAHIFICKFNTLVELENNWNHVVSHIALYYQSKIKEEIEKANFYIGFFIPFSIPNELKNKIELDTFCAKKIVFDEKEKCSNPCCVLEKRIFGLELANLHNTKNNNKISKICLQNFRGYAGKVTFDLNDKDNRPASFVLVYAPNGVGKTSFTDGIEFALKGEVDRLIRLEKQTNVSGPIYHHYDKANQKAFVQLFVKNEQGEEKAFSPRIVPKYENGTDTKLDRRTVKSDIKSNKNLWDMVILPQDKVDTFITSQSPEKRYSDWTKSDPQISNDAEMLKKLTKELKDKEKKILQIEKETNLKFEELNRVIEQKEGLDRVIELISKYNESFGDSERKIALLSSDSKLDDYYSMISEVNLIKGVIERKQDSIQKEVEMLDEWITTGLEKNDLVVDDFQKKEYEKKDLETKKALIFERSSISEKLSNFQNNKSNIVLEMKPYDELKKYGIENAFSELENERINKKNIDAYQEALIKINLKISEYKDELEGLIEEKKDKSHLLFYKDEAVTKADELELLQEKRKKYQVVSDELRKEMSHHNIDSERGIQVNLLEKLNDYNLIDKDEVSKVIAQSDYLGIELIKANSILEKLVNEQKNQDDIITQMQGQALEYLNEHKNICKCPVCNTGFKTWDLLISNINQVDEISKESYMIKLKEINENIYEIELKIKDLKNKEFNLLVNARSNIDALLKSNEEEINQIRKWYIDNNLFVEEYEINRRDVEALFYRIEQEIVLSNDRKDRREELNNLLRIAMDTKNSYEKEIEKLTGDSILFSTPSILTMIDLAKKIEDDYKKGRYDTLKKDLLEIELAIQNEELRLNEFDKLHKNIRFLDLNTVNSMIQKYEEELESKKSFIQLYISYYHEPKKVIIKRDEYINQLQFEENKLLYLSKIISEESAKDYLVNFKKLEESYNNTKINLEKSKEDYMKCKKNQEQLTNVVKGKIQDYFSKGDANVIYQKIDPNNDLSAMNFTLSFEDDKPQLNYEMTRKMDEKTYTAEMYLSTAQLNAVAFSSFFARALSVNNLEIQSIIVDDPIGSFDDMNILGFADLIRSIITHTHTQIIMTTHDSKIYNIMKRKIDSRFHSSRFFSLPDDLVVEEINEFDD